MRSFTLYLYISLLTYTIATISAENLPGDIELCHKKDPNLSGCLEKTIRKVFRTYKNGNKELNINSIDPLHVDELILVQSKNNKNFQLSLKLVDFYLHGYSSFNIYNMKVKLDGDTVVLDTAASLENATLYGNYGLDGQLLLLPIKAKDVFRTELYNGTMRCHLKLDPQEVDGTKYYQVKDLKVVIEGISGGKSDYENLIPGNKKLSNQMQEVLGANVKQLFDVYKPSISKFMSGYFEELTKKILSHLPSNQLLPD